MFQAICHRTDAGTSVQIDVADPAVAAHREHADGAPGEPVPGMAGMQFTATCEPEPAVTCPCYSLAQLGGDVCTGRGRSARVRHGHAERIPLIAGPGASPVGDG